MVKNLLQKVGIVTGDSWRRPVWNDVDEKVGGRKRSEIQEISRKRLSPEFQ